MPPVSDKLTALQCFGHDLTALAHVGRFAPLEGYEPWVRRVLEILVRPPNTRYNPVLLGLADGETWPVVAAIVHRIACEEVPAGLLVRQVVALDWHALVRDLPTGGETESWAAPEHRWYTATERAADLADLERFLQLDAHDDGDERQRTDPVPDPIHQRLEAVLVDVRRSAGQVLLYVEQLQRLFGAEHEPHLVDISDVLKPAFGRGEVRILGSCTLDAYRRYVESDAAMQRRFQEVCSRELSGYQGRDGV
jgi:ATP-dependent Clp protease ATP-binding subunit ClpB